jgi:hypothetical protein
VPPRLRSRFTFCEAAAQADGAVLLSEYEPYRFTTLADNVQHPVQDGDTWFNLAGKYFAPMDRPAGFFWVLCDFQPTPVIDPTIPPTTGSIVWVPSVRTLTEIILDESRRQVTTG